MTNLSEKAMLVSIRIGDWSGRALDRTITNEVNATHGASADAGRYNKALVAPSALAEITAIANKARKMHYSLSLPWLDDGTRIMSSAGYLEFAKQLRDVKAEFDAAVTKFLDDYPAHINAARARLNGMFRETDYPSVDDLRARYRFERRIWPMPAATDFRVDIGDEAQAAIRSDIEAQLNAAMSGAMRDAFRRVAETVGAMAAKLAEFKPAARKGDKAQGIFRDSLVENVRDLAAVLPALNITGDANLTALTDRMREICECDAAVLREHADVRKHVADTAAEIAQAAAAYF